MLKDKKLKPLSVMPYYGGKYKMAYLIADMIPYKDVDIYVEPFGGGGRVLLNKPRHKIEIYNELSEGAASIFSVLANPEKSDKFINCLFDSEVSEEYFNECKLYKNYMEMDCFEFKLYKLLETFEEFGEREGKAFKRKFTRLLKKLFQQDIYNECVEDYFLNNFEIEEVIDNMMSRFSEFISAIKKLDISEEKKKWTNETIKEIVKIVFYTYVYIYEKDNSEEAGISENIGRNTDWFFNMIHETIMEGQFKYNNTENIISRHLDKISDSEIRLAVASYVVYVQSRNALGIKWNGYKYKNDDTYYKRISKLPEIADRLNGVRVNSMDARIMFLEFKNNTNYLHWNEYLNNERVAMYLDPSYLKEKGIKRNGYNPGHYYNYYFTEEEHIQFLKMIQLAKCHIIVSNYDDDKHIYKRYLEYGEGLTKEEMKSFKPFKRLEVDTISTLGQENKVDRTEVLWYR